jgi:microsomal dipeptidase-like Zn-dependent dipeptidase
LNLYADFIGQNRDVDAAAAHILHFLELDPTGKHIALGGDLDGCDTLISGIEGIGDYDFSLIK